MPVCRSRRRGGVSIVRHWIGQGKKLDMDNEAQWDLVSLFLSISHSILSLTLSWYLAWEREKLAMIVVYRQRSGSQRFKPEERQTALLLVVLVLVLLLPLPTTETARKSKKGGWMDGEEMARVCGWWVCA